MPMLTFRAPPEIVEALEEAARRQPDSPNRSEMIRRIVTEWLKREGQLAENAKAADELDEPTRTEE